MTNDDYGRAIARAIARLIESDKDLFDKFADIDTGVDYADIYGTFVKLVLKDGRSFWIEVSETAKE